VGDAGDETVPFASLAAGASVSGTVTIPNTYSAGTAYGIVDSADAVTELDEGNNVDYALWFLSDLSLAYDFDDGSLQGWAADGLWHVTGNRSASAPNSVWYADPATGAYDTGAANSGSLTRSVCLDGYFALSFDYFLENECAEGDVCPWDKLTVEVSTDGGASWDTLVDLPVSSLDFTHEAVSLAAYSGSCVDVRFHFNTGDDVGNSFEGAYVDNVVIEPYAGTSYTSTDVPKAIPDLTTITSTLAVSGDTLSVAKVTVWLDITHTWDGDVDIYLVSPAGTTIELSTDNGGNGANYTDTVFDDAAASSITAGTAPFTGTFRPEAPLSGLAGEDANGTWTLSVYDDLGSYTGTLNGWGITVW
jgi:subtilisin-like proprotein convertase family protein